MALASQQRMLEILVEAVDTLTDEFDLPGYLHRLSIRCVELLPVEGAAVVLITQHGELQLVASSDEDTRLLELAALQDARGPSSRCYLTGQAQLNVELTSTSVAQDSGPFATRARDSDFVTVHTLPMKLRHQVVGSLNLFCSRPGPLIESDAQAGQGLSNMATIAILQQRALQQSHVEKVQLQTALTSRVAIEQAKGILSERHSLSLDDTFDSMRAYARPRHLRLTELAQQVIDDTLDPDFRLP